MQLTWTKSFELDTAKVDAVKVEGVYVIYQAGNPPRTIYVGKGDIAKRLTEHRLDSRFASARGAGKLVVTYAAVPKPDQEGVERHLATRLAPTVGEQHPDVREIAVNSPFAA